MRAQNATSVGVCGIRGLAKPLLLAGSCYAMFALSTAAHAQAGDGQTQEQADEASGLQDIIVTARRVEESLQDVPLSVNVLSAQQVSERQITQVIDLKGSIPNLIGTKTATAGGTQLNIRGQGSGTLPNISLDNRIGIYLDGVYVARTQGGSFALADIERVEVLKGPQGTQFGKNMTGGAINFITASPSGKAGGIVEASFGNLGRKRYRLTLETPQSGGLSLRGTYVHEQVDGDLNNLSAGKSYGRVVYAPNNFDFQLKPASKSFGGNDTESFFLALRYEASSGIQIDLKGDYTNGLESSSGNQTLGYAANFVGCAGAALQLGLPANCGPLATWALPLTSASANRNPTGFEKISDRYESLTAPSKIRNRGVSLTISYPLTDSLEIKSITGYRRINTRSQFELAGGDTYLINDNVNIFTGGAAGLQAGGLTPYCVSCSFQFQRQKQISEEVQLIGNAGEMIDYLAGFYYFKETGYSLNTYVANFNPIFAYFGSGLRGFEPDGETVASAGMFANGDDVKVDSRSTAIFGRTTWRPVERLELTVGARYTWDEKRNIISPTLQSLNIDPSTGARPPLDRTIRFNKFTYDGTVSYKFTPDVNVYGRWATAYVAGGMLRNIVFKPETTKAAEIGIKSEFFNRKLRFNAAAFWQKSKNSQAPISLPPLGALAVLNIGSNKRQGFEVETIAVPVDGLTLNVNLGYVDESASDGGRNQTPKWSANLGASYQLLETDAGSKVTVSARANYLSKYGGGRFPIDTVAGGLSPTTVLPAQVWQGRFDSQAAYLRALDEAMRIGDYWLIDARIGISEIPLGGAMASISGWVRNLTDEDQLVLSSNFGTTVAGYFDTGRTYGVDLRLEF
jgi:iron complex outermembrane recepter protein